MVAFSLVAILLGLILIYGMKGYLRSDTPQVAVTTQSMEPVYQGFVENGNIIDPLDGDLLLVQKRNPKNIHQGDVIVFDNPSENGERIVHRVIDVKIDEEGAYYFRTKGDNPSTNKNPDRWEWVSADKVHGVVIFRIPFIGWLALEIQKETNRLFLLLLAASFLLLSFRESKEATEEDSKTNDYQIKSQKGNILNLITRKMISFSHSRKIVIVGLILGIFFLSFISSLHEASDSCKITLDSDETIYNASHSETWLGTNNVSRSFIPLTIKLESHGFFNHIRSFKIITKDHFGNESRAYRWTTTYSFVGEKKIAAGLILDTDPGTHDYVIELIPHCSGLFARGEVFQKNITIIM